MIIAPPKVPEFPKNHPRILSLDCETFLIRPGLLTPKLVCVSYAYRTVVNGQSTIVKGLFDHRNGLAFARACLEDETLTIVTQNGVYDFGVFAAEDPTLLPLIFKAYESGRIRCVRIRQKLIDIATGELEWYWDEHKKKRSPTKHRLQDHVWRHFGEELAKEGTWRLRYTELYGVPLAEWPEDATRYALDDASWTLSVFFSQDKALEEPTTDEEKDPYPYPLAVPNEIPQTCASWSLHLMSAWGIRTDKVAVDKLQHSFTRDLANAAKKLKELKLVREDGSKDLGAIMERVEWCFQARGLEVPKTPGGKTASDRQTIVDADDPTCHCGHPLEEHDTRELLHDGPCKAIHLGALCPCEAGQSILGLLDAFKRYEKILSTYLPTLVFGTQAPLNAPYNPLVGTGRTSCGGAREEGDSESFNIQNPPRKGGVRECYIPRGPRFDAYGRQLDDGFVFISCDYDTLELRTLAQACLVLVGESAMAEALRRGEDLHSAFAADLMGISYAEFEKRLQAGDPEAEEKRQFAKIANFGFPGGMVGATLVDYAKGYGIKISAEMGAQLHREWKRKWPEMEKYFRMIKSLVGKHGEGVIAQLFSNRIRGGLRYTAAANTYFQGLAADGAKDALWHVTKECYLASGYGPVDMASGYGAANDNVPSPLFGSRPVIFLHDEIIIEARNAWSQPKLAASAAQRLKEVMIARMAVWLPDIPVKASPVMMRRWRKGAKPAYVEVANEKLMVPSKPWKDEKGRTKWVPDLPEILAAAA